MMNKLIATAALSLASTVSAGALAFGALAYSDAPTVEAPSGRRVCADSNGSKPGGSVYIYEGSTVRCDVVPPQRLHVLRSNRASCDHMGGQFDTRSRICWDVDY